MNEPSPSDQEDFQQELEALRLILQRNLQKLKQHENPMLGKQLNFWIESASFLRTELDIWEKVGNVAKREQAVERMRKVLDILQELVNSLNDGEGQEEP